MLPEALLADPTLFALSFLAATIVPLGSEPALFVAVARGHSVIATVSGRQLLRGVSRLCFRRRHMFRQAAVTALMTAALTTTSFAQARKPAGANAVTYDVTVQADGTYTGTMDIATAGGKVSGAMRITTPTEIVGKVAGTTKARELRLDFPYEMVARKCTGQIAMTIKMPEQPGPASGTVSIVGCGRDASNKLSGTIELKPAPKKS